MSWLLPAVTANVSSTALLTLLYLYLYLQDRQRYLKIWMISWAAYTLRFALNLFMMEHHSPVLLLTAELAHLTSGVLLLFGLYEFINKPFPRIWISGSALIAVWLPLALASGFSFQITTTPVFLFLGLVFIWTGTTFLRLPPADGWGRIVLGVSFILWGFHKLNFPFLRPVPWFAPWGYLIASVLGLATALGIILYYFEKTRTKLQLSEERFRLLAENARDVVYRLGVKPALAVDYISPAVCALTGRRPEEFYADPGLLFEIVHPEDLPRLREMLQTKADGPVVLRWLDERGRTVWVEQQNTPITDHQNNLIAIEGIARDITSRIYAEERTRQLQVHHSLILESMGEGIFGLDREGRTTFVNQAGARMLGWQMEALIGKRIPELCYAGGENGANPEGICSCIATMDDGVTRQGRKLFRRRDGTTFQAEYTCVPIKSAGSPTGVVVTFQDITAREKTETEKNKLHDQLLQIQKVEAIGQLAGGIAHDFNNLLMAINGYGQLLLQQLGPASRLRQDVEEILRAGERASALTRQLLAFSRRQPLQPRVIDLNRIIGDMEKMLRRLIGEDIRFNTSFAPDLPQVNVDPGQIEQVIMNLVVNARDAMPDGGFLTVKTSALNIDEEYCRTHPNGRPGSFVCLSVEDTGTGMSRELTRRIFEPFFSTKGRQGTGLGLSVVYGIIDQHEGWITVYSEPDQGANFQIYLPSLTGSRNTTLNHALLSLQRIQGHGERILLAEDDEKVQQLVSRFLGANGYQVQIAASAAEAVTLFSRSDGNFNMLFTDIVLPDRSGLQLVDELLARQPALKILVTSGYTDHKSQWPRIQERGYRFLEKPFGLTLLLQSVREVLDG